MGRLTSYKRIAGFFTKLSAVLAVFLALLLFLFIKFKLTTVEVVGSTYYTKEELAKQLQTSPLDSNTLLFYLRHRFGEQKRIPYIEKMDYTMKDSHTVEIRVYEKILVGCVKVMGQYLYFDKDGYVTDSTKDRLTLVPRITGLEFDRILLYEKLEIQKDSLFDTILNLTKLVWDYEIPVETIEFSGHDEVTFYIGDITVLLGKHDTYDEAISALGPVLAASEGMKITIDMKNYKEGQGGITATPSK